MSSTGGSGPNPDSGSRDEAGASLSDFRGASGRSGRDVFREELESRGIRTPRMSGAWIWMVVGIAFGLSLVAYRLVPQRGTSVLGRGHVLVDQAGAGTWVFLSDGSMIEVVPETVAELGLTTGACSMLRGWIQEKRLVLEQADCVPGSLLRPVMERVRELRLTIEYWGDELEPEEGSPEPYLDTVELYASMVDRRFEHPQLVPLYRELFPGRLGQLRQEGVTGKPMILHVRRNDFVGRRLNRAGLDTFLGPEGPVARHGFFLAGAAAKGGWLVREVVYEPNGPGPVERLLVAPVEAPWPELLESSPVRVRPPVQAGD